MWKEPPKNEQMVAPGQEILTLELITLKLIEETDN